MQGGEGNHGNACCGVVNFSVVNRLVVNDSVMDTFVVDISVVDARRSPVPASVVMIAMHGRSLSY